MLARAGRIGAYFAVDGNRPSLADIDKFLDQCSAEVNDAIRGYGLDPAQASDDDTASLQDLVAYGALARGLRGIGDGSPQIAAMLEEADGVWLAALGNPNSRQPAAVAGTIASGTHPVIKALMDGAGGASQVDGTDFWSENPEYGRPFQAREEWLELRGTNLAPGVRRGQHL